MPEASGPSQAARRLFDEAIVIDALDTSAWGEPGVFDGVRAGGLTAVNATAAIWEGFEDALANLTNWLHWFEANPDLIRPVRGTDDIRAAKSEGRTGIILGWQNATPVGDDIRRFRLFHELGLRVVQLTYNERNLFGNGCWEISDGGLSRIGRAAVREMNDVGILIDLSHVGDRTVLETIAHSRQPVAFTHANARSQFDHPRNKTDEAIRELTSAGGVVGANAFPAHHPRGFDATLEDYLDAVAYLVDLAGIDHVGLGTDFCMGRTRAWFEWIAASHGQAPYREMFVAPEPYRHLHGLAGPREFVNVADGLLRRGFDAADARKLLGENWLRLFDTVWSAA